MIAWKQNKSCETTYFNKIEAIWKKKSFYRSNRSFRKIYDSPLKILLKKEMYYVIVSFIEIVLYIFINSNVSERRN